MIEEMIYKKSHINDIVRTIGVIVDTREQNWGHIHSWLEKHNLPYKIEKLDFGDYSFYLPENEKYGILEDIEFTSEVTVERKGCLDEFIGNLVERKRIEAEFKRKTGTMHLLIENSTYEDMKSGNYKSNFRAKSAVGTYHTFVDAYDLKPMFLPYSMTPNYIYCIGYYFIRNRLKENLDNRAT